MRGRDMCRIVPADAGEDDLFCRAEWAFARKLVADQPLLLRCGQVELPVRLRPVSPGSEPVFGAPSSLGLQTLALSRPAWQRLSLPSGRRLHVRCDAAAGIVRVGPVIGIFALRGERHNDMLGLAEYFKALVRRGRRLGMLVYVFEPGDIDWERRLVHGSLYHRRRKRWYRRWVPLPDVVYDRIQTREHEASPDVQAAKTALQALPLQYFNAGFFDKWEVYATLRGRRRVRRYLPATRRLEGVSDLRVLLRRNRRVYVKPIHGSLGAGIVVIGRRRGAYWYRNFAVRRGFGRRRTLDGVWRALQLPLDRHPYIVQRGLTLARYQGRPFDVRVLMQKDGRGRWRISRSFARMGSAGALRTNVDAGAEVRRLDRVLRVCFKGRAPLVRRRIHAAARRLADAWDRASPSIVGELGLDLGVDRRGRVWLIEINAKPVRSSVKRWPRSVSRPLRFARRLAGF